MNRKPRHKKKDRLVNAPLALYSYLHIGARRGCPETHLLLWGGVGCGGSPEESEAGHFWGQYRTSPVLLGLMQALGAFVTYFTVYAQQGFLPSTILNLRVEWEKDNVNDLEDSYGQEWVRARLLAAPSLDGCKGTEEVMVFLEGPVVTAACLCRAQLISQAGGLELTCLH